MAAPLQFDLPGFTTEGQKLFRKRSQQLIGALNQRMKKKGFKGRLALASGRAALAKGVGKPCRYCGERIKIKTMSPDHPTPLARGGNAWEIECICRSCNEIKSELMAEEFQALLNFIKTLCPEAQADLKRRLHAGAFGIRMMAQRAGRKYVKKEKAAEPAG
jgi:5-methylcytosine-specific restriction endonuclease McrA